ncbi:MAG TPA: phenylalanine--tRNA ligase subunit alpha, partial [Oceanicaulis sp.]|nr:phenylalanine--tRNA ligase subunit alpha [Oceanicaulis sp.]
MTTLDDLAALDTRYMAAIDAAGDIPALEEVRVAALGKKGEVSLKMRDLGSMSPDERKVFGPALNGLKDSLTRAIEAKKTALEADALNAALASERMDITLPAP